MVSYTCCNAFAITLTNKYSPIWLVLNPSTNTFKFNHRLSTASIAGPKRIDVRQATDARHLMPAEAPADRHLASTLGRVVIFDPAKTLRKR